MQRDMKGKLLFSDAISRNIIPGQHTHTQNLETTTVSEFREPKHSTKISSEKQKRCSMQSKRPEKNFSYYYLKAISRNTPREDTTNTHTHTQK
jgi:hypothetical protein